MHLTKITSLLLLGLGVVSFCEHHEVAKRGDLLEDNDKVVLREEAAKRTLVPTTSAIPEVNITPIIGEVDIIPRGKTPKKSKPKNTKPKHPKSKNTKPKNTKPKNTKPKNNKPKKTSPKTTPIGTPPKSCKGKHNPSTEPKDAAPAKKAPTKKVTRELSIFSRHWSRPLVSRAIVPRTEHQFYMNQGPVHVRLADGDNFFTEGLASCSVVVIASQHDVFAAHISPGTPEHMDPTTFEVTNEVSHTKSGVKALIKLFQDSGLDARNFQAMYITNERGEGGNDQVPGTIRSAIKKRLPNLGRSWYTYDAQALASEPGDQQQKSINAAVWITGVSQGMPVVRSRWDNWAVYAFETVVTYDEESEEEKWDLENGRNMLDQDDPPYHDNKQRIINAFDVVLRAINSRPYTIESATQLLEVAKMAQRFRALPVLSDSLYKVLFNDPKLRTCWRKTSSCALRLSPLEFKADVRMQVFNKEYLANSIQLQANCGFFKKWFEQQEWPNE
ncbi:hypothetical protein G7Y89_g6851 [Cudoniella acicularis]|uniref:Uncharacterized protein n=1 Tax=Cudoniella acicularis TaxID=354080 RepID=A0A8H4RM86_9HELO|nr:hypothetical protein G7Y89_g6851 [Cudoniella acicularis]